MTVTLTPVKISLFNFQFIIIGFKAITWYQKVAQSTHRKRQRKWPMYPLQKCSALSRLWECFQSCRVEKLKVGLEKHGSYSPCDWSTIFHSTLEEKNVKTQVSRMSSSAIGNQCKTKIESTALVEITYWRCTKSYFANIIHVVNERSDQVHQKQWTFLFTCGKARRSISHAFHNQEDNFHDKCPHWGLGRTHL